MRPRRPSPASAWTFPAPPRLLLLSLAARLGGNAPPAVAQGQNGGVPTLLGDGNVVGDERVLSANPRFYDLPAAVAAAAEGGDGTTPPPLPEGLEVIGVLFNVRSRLPDDESTIYVTGLELRTSIPGTVFYEVRSREGPYYDDDAGKDGGEGIGEWKSFELISDGLADGSGECDQLLDDRIPQAALAMSAGAGAGAGGGEGVGDVPAFSCPLTVVPPDAFYDEGVGVGAPDTYPWTLRGRNATRSFYVTLASKHLLVSPGTPGDPHDVNVAASTPDLDLYEGVATRTYPLHANESDYYHDAPAGFVGRIRYRVGGTPGTAAATTAPAAAPVAPAPAKDGVTTSPAPTEEGTVSLPAPTEGGATTAPAPAPTPTEGGVAPGPTPLEEALRPPQAPASDAPLPTPWPTSPAPTVPDETPSPTAKPTRRCRPGRPCLQPPPPAEPTMSPLVSSPSLYAVELIVYVEDVPGRQMAAREREEYEETMKDFLRKDEELRRAGVAVQRAKIFYHNVYEEEPKKKGGRGGRRPIDAVPGRNDTCSFMYHYNTNSHFVPKVRPTVYIMTELEVMTKLPYNVAAFFVWDRLRLNEMALIRLFRAQSLFVSYFRTMTNMTFEVVEDMTAPPTTAPTVKVEAAEEVEDEGMTAVERRNLYVWVGVGLGALWSILTVCSFKQIFRHRKRAKRREKLKRQREVGGQMSSRKLVGQGRRLTEMASLRELAGLKRLSLFGGTNVGGGARQTGRRPNSLRETANRASAELAGELSDDDSIVEESARPRISIV